MTRREPNPPAVTALFSEERLRGVLIYLITPCFPGSLALQEMLMQVLPAGVDVVQLRDKQANRAQIEKVSEQILPAVREAGALFIVNDHVEVAASVGADGVHLGQEDMPVGQARHLLPAGAVIGLSTHSQAQVVAAQASGADYIGVGPVYATPTKQGRPPVGLELVRFAETASRLPFFAIGGIEPSNLADVVSAGGRRVSVQRAITQSRDPAAVVRQMRSLLEVG